ncbi:hypothetical protein BVRB_1g014750 [Beta vulgaris subsp. vulgaris]|nr:hypothetical protein BVRB_1g014750 [Beta vulgaris subsp. vulgaris]
MAATTSTSCNSFWNNRTGRATKARASSSLSSSSSSSSLPSHPSCGKVDNVAMWLINGVTSAFFASLERCSCIRVTTVEDGEDINELPLIFDDGNTNIRQEVKVSSIRKRRVRGKKGGGYAYQE